MESVIYDESPLAEYLEGDATPCDNKPTHTPFQTGQYAPTPPHLTIADRLRFLHRTAKSVTDLSDSQYLERFRYIIVASQLLDDSKSRLRPVHDQNAVSITFSLNGVFVVATFSFLVAWFLNWTRARSRQNVQISATEVLIYIIIAACGGLVIGFVARRQYQKFVRESTAVAASNVVKHSHRFDGSLGNSLRFIQEIEIVARGYEMYNTPPNRRHELTSCSSHPLPPVSRLEDQRVARQCPELRQLVFDILVANITQLVNGHDQLQLFLNAEDLKNYHHIYEISTEELASAVKLANEISIDSGISLKQLRLLVQVYHLARKCFLIDLLALRASSAWSDVYQWRIVLQMLHSLAQETARVAEHLDGALTAEEYADDKLNTDLIEDELRIHYQRDANSPRLEHAKSQLRRFEALINSIRTMNAKAKLARSDIADHLSSDCHESPLTAVVAKHYEDLGSELRSLMMEWERGRNTMLLGLAADGRSSRPSSGIRSPLSPSPSLGGLTMVDGGPGDALKLLNGEDDHSDPVSLDEEVFEAVARPRKRMSLAFSREEKLAKLQEDRKKRATLQEQADTTTNMLRELQMVIKHRPHQRQTSQVTSM